MKICFFSSDKEIKKISQLMEGVEISVLNSTSNVSNYLENNTGDKTLLFLDLDDGDSAHELNRKYLEDGQVIRIMITETVPIKKLKKHQAGKESAFGYIKKPLTPEIVSGVLNDFELSEYVEKNDLTHEGDKVEQDQVELTFIGIKKPDLTNVPLEEDDFPIDDNAPQFDSAPEESTGTMGDMNELRVKMDKTDVEIDEIDLDDDIDLGDDHSQTDHTPIPEPMPIPMSNKEKTAFIEKGMMEEEGAVPSSAPPYESVANEGIQEKFDRVFGVEKSASNAPTVDDLPEDQQDDFEEPEPLEEVNITLDGFDDDDDLDEGSTVSAPDEINLDEGEEREKTQVVIEKAIINDPDLDGKPAEAIVSQNESDEDASLVSRIDEDDLSSSETKGNFMEVSLADIQLDDLGVTDNSGEDKAGEKAKANELEEELEFGTSDNISFDSESTSEESAAADTQEEEELNEYGLKKGHVEDGFMYMGGDPSDANNWKEVKS